MQSLPEYQYINVANLLQDNKRYRDALQKILDIPAHSYKEFTIEVVEIVREALGEIESK